MDRSTRNLSMITLLVLAIFLALNHIATRAALADWGLVLLFLLLALAIWFYDRVSRRGAEEEEPTDTLIEPVVYDQKGEQDSVLLVSPNPGTVIHTAPHAVVVPAEAPPAPAPTSHEQKSSVPPAHPEVPQPVSTGHPPTAADLPASPMKEDEARAPMPTSVLETASGLPTEVKEVVPEAPPSQKPAAASAVKAAAPDAKPSKAAKSNKADDLKIIEGIGPKMEKALKAAGITTFAILSGASETQIREAITAAGMRFAPSVPTWAEQASFAANGDFVGLEAFQKTLVAGRKS
ncbi:MAG: hypothetical protein GC179_11390 [Anaerolineaceae bacterium]|nr:hypothetical protein [Anaerolineaceae bacterium]